MIDDTELCPGPNFSPVAVHVFDLIQLRCRHSGEDCLDGGEVPVSKSKAEEED